MSILGIDRITYGVADAARCRKFFLDWGLKLVRESGDALDFETMNGCEVHVRGIDDPTLPPAIEDGSTLREVAWGVESRADVDALRAQLRGASRHAQRRRLADPQHARRELHGGAWYHRVPFETVATEPANA